MASLPSTTHLDFPLKDDDEGLLLVSVSVSSPQSIVTLQANPSMLETLYASGRAIFWRRPHSVPEIHLRSAIDPNDRHLDNLPEQERPLVLAVEGQSGGDLIAMTYIERPNRSQQNMASAIDELLQWFVGSCPRAWQEGAADSSGQVDRLIARPIDKSALLINLALLVHMTPLQQTRLVSLGFGEVHVLCHGGYLLLSEPPIDPDQNAVYQAQARDILPGRPSAWLLTRERHHWLPAMRTRLLNPYS